MGTGQRNRSPLPLALAVRTPMIPYYSCTTNSTYSLMYGVSKT